MYRPGQELRWCGKIPGAITVWWEHGPRTGGTTVGDERDRHPGADEPDVEAHKLKARAEEAEKEKDESDDKDEPDVEAHKFK